MRERVTAIPDDTLTVADTWGLPVGTLATVVRHDEHVPVNSLVRVVADEFDDLVAVDVLMPTEPFNREYEWATGRNLNVRSVNKGTRVLDTVDQQRVYYWVSVLALRPLNDNDSQDNGPTVGPEETDHG